MHAVCLCVFVRISGILSFCLSVCFLAFMITCLSRHMLSNTSTMSIQMAAKWPACLLVQHIVKVHTIVSNVLKALFLCLLSFASIVTKVHKIVASCF